MEKVVEKNDERGIEKIIKVMNKYPVCTFLVTAEKHSVSTDVLQVM